jgi:hypothetical protein
MSFDIENLYSLLPAVYRIRDIELAEQLDKLLTPGEQAELQSLRQQARLTAEEGKRLGELEAKRQRGPLKALLSVMAEQAAVLEDNLDQLYDDLFIETCAEWVVPYIGDLVGARGVSAFPGSSLTERAFVANTIRYRRRKGTAAVLEQLARDLTDWDASVVEYFQLLATTQYMNHIRLENLSVANVSDSKSLDFINTPFDRVTRTVDVRRIETRRGKYNIPNIGLFLWRLGSYSVTNAPAFKLDDRRYLFDALGKDIQLYNDPQTEEEITHLAEPVNVPLPLPRRLVHRYLSTYYGPGKSLLLNVNGQDVPSTESSPPTSPYSVRVCDLSDLKDAVGNVIDWAHMPTDKIAIDPVLGRIAFPAKSPPAPAPTSVQVTYHYGFSADMGGGEYAREQTFIGSGTEVKVPAGEPTILQALNQIATQGGVVEITNNNIFFETPAIEVAPGEKREIELRAADGRRPVLALSGDLMTSGVDGSEVTLNGLLIAGRVRVPLTDSSGKPNKIARLRLRHCTLAPGAIPAIKAIGASPPIEAPAQSAAPKILVELADTIIEIDHCIVGAIRAVAGAQVIIRDSIVDATDASEIAFAGLSGDDPGARLTIENSSVIGKVYTHTMKLASNTIFFSDLKATDIWPAPVRAERLQQGCVRFSFVPPGSQLPRLHHCQPAKLEDAARVRPVFTSLRYGDAGYCQLSPACAVEITQGADDQAEMGAFHNLYQPRREANLRAALDEYLRFGLEAAIFYAS